MDRFFVDLVHGSADDKPVEHGAKNHGEQPAVPSEFGFEVFIPGLDYPPPDDFHHKIRSPGSDRWAGM